MNDRFKFRVWNIKENFYCDQCGNMVMSSDGHCYDNGVRGDFSASDGLVVEQCTGLKDKNGNLIYENDVLFDGEFCGQVIWKDGCWLVEMTLYDGDKSYEHLDQHFAKYGEIIGNIHEQKDAE